MNAVQRSSGIDSSEPSNRHARWFSDLSARELFHRLLRSEHRPGVLEIASGELAQQLESVDVPHMPIRFDTLPEPVAESDFPPSDGAPNGASDNLLLGYSPCGLLELCWLGGAVQTASAHTAVSAHLFRVYRQAFQRQVRYRRLLADIDPNLPDIRSPLFMHLPAIPDEAFLGAVVRLCLTRFPRRYLPELIGFTLAHETGASPITRALRAYGLTDDQRRLQPPVHDTAETNTSANQAAEHLVSQAHDESARADSRHRISQGFALYQSLETSLFNRLRESENRTVAEKVATLLAHKAPYASGHHKSASLGGKPLDCRFAETPFQTRSFLEALARSTYVNLDVPHKSRLFELMAPSGPMFGVFSERERRLMLEWLEQGAPAPELTGVQGEAKTALRTSSRDLPEIGVQNAAPTASDLFHRLINGDCRSGVLAEARRHVETALKPARRAVYRKHRGSLTVFPYDAAYFENRVHEIYQAELKRYRPLEGAPKISREAYRWAIEQMAPTILVDGCWLQNIGPLHGANGVASRLFQIYADEIGNGQTRLNHSNVYRKLLAELNISLPEATSHGFPTHPGFIKGAFDLPCYLLAISHFPETFLPELLGLNLAIELSGLGATYMRLADELEFWGIDSQIVRLHISIDNMASGHAAMARETVILHLETIRALGGDTEVQAHWKRILTGYCSLRTVPRAFARRLALAYFMRFRIGTLFSPARRC